MRLRVGVERMGGQGVIAAVEERFLVPAYTSRAARRWIAGHRALAWPLTRQGPVTHHIAQSASGPVRIACAGRPKRFAELLARFGAQPIGTSAPIALRDPRAHARLDADLVLVHVHRWHAGAFRRAGWSTVPDAVRWLGRTDSVPPAHPTESLRCDLRMIARHGYRLECASGLADWAEFYETMVEPAARARFGDGAWLPSLRLRRQLQARARLHFARCGALRVAGLCAVPAGDRLWLPVAGVRGGDPELRRRQAGGALLALTFEWARANGYATIDNGRTSPFLCDGIACYKRKWGFEPVPDPLAHVIAVRPAPDSRAAGELLGAHPMLCETAAGLAPLGADRAG
jgi:hypothetical protein